uniref:Uncharacterized protein n=1 Tax=Cacopsylla melanoneura TaxID=428564 RepID=A0A8D8ZCE8_9HEMI
MEWLNQARASRACPNEPATHIDLIRPERGQRKSQHHIDGPKVTKGLIIKRHIKLSPPLKHVLAPRRFFFTCRGQVHILTCRGFQSNHNIKFHICVFLTIHKL